MPAEVTLQLPTIWLACLALYWLPGAALARLLRLPRPSDWLLRSSLELGLGLSIWPLLLLWTTVAARHFAGPAWSPALLRIVAGAVCLASLAAVLWHTLRRPHPLRHDFLRQFLRQWPWLLLFAILFALAWLTRSWHIRRLVLPNWVDSVHHLLIVRLIVEQGMLPATYGSSLADAGLSYHWGLHAWVAWLAWLLGITDSFDLARLLLLFGQLLNILMLWMLYAAGRALFASRRAGFLAAALGMFVSWLPAYYTAWGRYTHLAGLLLAIPLLIALWRLARSRAHVAGWLVVASLAAAALALTHVRVALFAAIWAGLLLVFLAVRRDWRALSRWAIAGGLALLLIAPWLITLADHPRAATLVASVSPSAPSWQSAWNRIPWGLVWTPGMRELAALATGGLSELPRHGEPFVPLRLAAGLWFFLVAGILLWQRRTARSQPPFPWRPLALAGSWCAALFCILNADALGLPRLAFLSLNSAAITLFLPAGLAAGGLTAWAIGAITPLRRQRLSTFIVTAAVAAQGAAGMRDIVNPQTVLAAAADLPALHWIRDHAPPDARFAVNAWRWLGNTYAGSDAGYWIPALTDRQTILPPALYTLTLSRDQVVEINDLLDAWTASPDLSNPALIDRLRSAGVTHIYVGQRSERAQADALARLPTLELVYERDSVYIFRIKEPHETSAGQNTP